MVVLTRSIVLLLGVLFASAQGAQDNTEILLSVDFGFRGSIPAERFAPIAVWVQTGDEPVSGTLVIQYSGWSGRSVRLKAPFAASAGVLVRVPLVAKFPTQIEQLSVTLLGDQGDPLGTTEYASLPDSSQLQLPPMMINGDELVVSLTRRVDLDEISQRWRASGLAVDVSQNRYWRSSTNDSIESKRSEFGERIGDAMRLLGLARTVSLTPSELPASRMAYDGALVVIADGSTVRQAEPRTIAGLQRWVIGGGRLVILANDPGSLWRGLLPEGTAADAIHLAPVQQVTTPEELALLAKAEARSSLQARPISMDLRGIDLGWSLRWGNDGAAMLAEGPVGFGWVTVLSVHPDTVSPQGPDANWTTWADALSGGVIAASPEGAPMRNFGSPLQYDWLSSSTSRRLASRIFDSISLAPPITMSAFILVGSVMVFLAIAIGPLDYVVLGIFKARHLAWLSALGWIGVASVVAYVMPNKMRGSSSAVGRFTVVDQLAPNMALPGQERHPANRSIAALPESLRSWRTGLTSIFAGSQKPFKIEPDGSGAHWSQLRLASETQNSRPLELIEPPNSGGLEAVHTVRPQEIRPGIWAVSTLADRGPVRPDLRLALERVPGRGWAGTIQGLPDSAYMTAARLQIGSTIIPLSAARLGTYGHHEGIWRLMFDDDLAEPATTIRPNSALKVDEQEDLSELSIGSNRVAISMDAAEMLMGPNERTASIMALIKTGRFAMLQLQFTQLPLDIDIHGEDLVSHRTTSYRIVIPIVSDGPETSDD